MNGNAERLRARVGRFLATAANASNVAAAVIVADTDMFKPRVFLGQDARQGNFPAGLMSEPKIFASVIVLRNRCPYHLAGHFRGGWPSTRPGPDPLLFMVAILAKPIVEITRFYIPDQFFLPDLLLARSRPPAKLLDDRVRAATWAIRRRRPCDRSKRKVAFGNRSWVKDVAPFRFCKWRR